MHGNEILCEEALFLKVNNFYSVRVISDSARVYELKRKDLDKFLVDDPVVKENFTRFCTRKVNSLARRLINVGVSGFEMFKLKVKEEQDIKKLNIRHLLGKNKKTKLILKNEKLTKIKRQLTFLPAVETSETSPKYKAIKTEFTATSAETRILPLKRRIRPNKKIFTTDLENKSESRRKTDVLRTFIFNTKISVMDLNRSSIGRVRGTVLDMPGKVVKPKKYQKTMKRVIKLRNSVSIKL